MLVLRLNLIGKKRCTKCSETKTNPEYSYIRRLHRRASVCKRCNADRVSALAKASGYAYYHQNKERIRKRIAEYTLKNRESVTQIQKEWASRNYGKCVAATRRYRRRNPDKAAEFRQRRHARLKNAPGGSFSVERYAARVAYFGGLCAYCRLAPYSELDHAIPLSRGGSNWPANVYPACVPCNRRKHTRKLYSEWRP